MAYPIVPGGAAVTIQSKRAGEFIYASYQATNSFTLGSNVSGYEFPGFNIYVKKGSLPTLLSYDSILNNYYPFVDCSITHNVSGTWYIGFYHTDASYSSIYLSGYTSNSCNIFNFVLKIENR